MKKSRYSTCCLLLRHAVILPVIVLLAWSCASKQIEVKHFKSYDEVYEGEEARLEWSFKNADRVRIEGMPGYYQPIDVVYLKPEETTKYNIIAYRGSDSLVVTARIGIKNSDKPKGIRRGSTMLKSLDLKPGYLESELLSGVIEANNTKGPARLKVMRIVYPSGDQKSFFIRALLMDRFGNQITQAAKIGPVPRFKAENTCEGIKSLQLIRDYSETYMSPQNLDLGIILDNSAASENNDKVFETVRDFVQYLSPTDNVMFSVFNQNFNELLSLMPAEQALPEFENLEIPQRKGLNAMYNAAITSIRRLGTGENPSKALVVVTYNTDNSSVTLNANDVLKAARDNNIPVYILAIGSSVNTFILKYVTQSTGGRLYSIGEDEVDKIPSILKEIWFAQKSYYELKLSIPNEYRECKSLKTTLSCEMGENRLLESINLIMKPLAPYSLFQAVCTFDYRSSEILSGYNELIAKLSNYLRENPEMNIELTGHSSIEGNMSFNNTISLERAERIKTFLVKDGIEAPRIHVRGIGCCKPVYYLEQYPWQADFNRRVEVRWLDPQSLPYEIIAESLTNETEAQTKSDLWESYGYRSYYERYLMNNIPSYRVKLWGFSTYDEAAGKAKELEKKYNQAFLVE